MIANGIALDKSCDKEIEDMRTSTSCCTLSVVLFSKTMASGVVVSSLTEATQHNNEDVQDKDEPLVVDWLSARYLLRSLDNNVIDQCYELIISSFANKREILNILIKSLNAEQIKKVINILKIAQTKQCNKKKKMVKKRKKKKNTKCRYFDYLSQESIYNICEFLDGKDIFSFKLCSTFISLICLEIMNNFKIGVFNMMELIFVKEYKYPLANLDLNKKIKINYYKPFNKYESLICQYSKRYNIKLNNMLILQSYKSHGLGIDYGIYNNSLCKSTIVKNISKFNNTKIEKKRELFIFDKQKVLILNNKYQSNKNNLQTMSSINQSINEMNNHYNIVLLQYYDIKKQRLQNLHFLWLCYKTELNIFEQYIFNDLHCMFDKNQSIEWLQDLYYTMDKMKQFTNNNNNYKLINIYLRKRVNVNTLQYYQYNEKTYWQRNDKYDNNDMDKDFTIITFELNYQHPYFQINSFQSEIIRIEPFYCNVSKYVTDQTAKYKLELQYIHDDNMFISQIKYLDKNCIFRENHRDEIIDKNLILNVTPLTTFLMIKQKICNLFDNIFGIEQVQIYRGKYPFHGSVWNKSWNTNDKYSIIHIESNHNQIAKNNQNYSYKYEIIPYQRLELKEEDEDDDDDDNNHIYKVSIYDEEIDFVNYTNIFQSFNNKKMEHTNCKQLHIRYNNFTTINNKESKIIRKSGKQQFNLLNFADLEQQLNDTSSNNDSNGFMPLSASSSSSSLSQLMQIDHNDNNDKTEWITIKINVDDFINNLIETMSHKMYGQCHTYFIDKFKEKNNYSFIVFNDDDDGKCYGLNSYYNHQKLSNPFEKIHYFNMNILIIPNIDYDKDKYPIIVRFKKAKTKSIKFYDINDNMIDSQKNEFGYPSMIYITNKCTPNIMIKRYFKNKSNKFEIYSCSSKIYGNIDKNEIIYDKTYNDQLELNTPQLLITLQINNK